MVSSSQGLVLSVVTAPVVVPEIMSLAQPYKSI